MTMASTTIEKDSWTDSGVFSFFNFTQAVIKYFTIDTFLLFDEIQPSGRPDDEVDRFLKDRDTSIGMLDNYRQIKSLFVKYNTVIPTSAPVERLFSLAALILTIIRNKLSDSMLEMLIFLKIALNL